MGIVPNQRVTRRGWIQDAVPNSSGASSSNNTKKRWSNLVPFFLVFVVIAEIAFLGRLDMAKNAALLAESFYQISLSSPSAAAGGDGVGLGSWGLDRSSEVDGCEEWLEREDSLEYSRNFKKEPVLVNGGDQEWKSCAVGCKFEFNPDKKPDAAFGLPQQSGTASVLRSMESSQFFPQNNIAFARRWVSML
ncbi:glycoprotein 3-alpha-L-fucosyltransferase [Sarracenia purpurea var. burkii]